MPGMCHFVDWNELIAETSRHIAVNISEGEYSQLKQAMTWRKHFFFFLL